MGVPQSLDPICAKFDKFLAHGQAPNHDDNIPPAWRAEG